MRSIEVLEPGPLTTVQDSGRLGYASLGVPRSGALDAPAYELGNRLVGNPRGAAALETTSGGLRLRVPVSLTVAVTGALCDMRVAGRAVGWAEPVAVAADDVIEIGQPRWGVRSYLAVAGGFDVEPVLGSRSTDLLSHLGPPPLQAGDVLPVGEPGESTAGVDIALYRPPAQPLVVTMAVGPRDDWFEPDVLSALGDLEYVVAPDSNRIAVRLDGQPLRRSREGELAPEGIALGAVQVPPDGQPLIFLHDHPTTGGYPVVGVVDTADVAPCAQLRPGDRLRLRPQ